MPATSPAHESFGLFIDQCVQALCFRQGMQWMAMVAAAAQTRPYQPTSGSAAATRQALGAAGLSVVPGTRSRRLSAAERARGQAKAEATKWGY